MSEIFGTSNAKIVGTGDPDTATVNLLYGKWVGVDWGVADTITNTSILTGKRNIIHKGNHSSFSLIIYLKPYGTPAQQRTKVQEILPYVYKFVTLYPFTEDEDGNPIDKPVKDSTSTNVRFFISGYKFGYLDSWNTLDTLTLFFESETYTDVSKSVI